MAIEAVLFEASTSYVHGESAGEGSGSLSYMYKIMYYYRVHSLNHGK